MTEKTKTSLKIAPEEARSELIDFLENSGVEVDTSLMTDEDKAGFEKNLQPILQPMIKGRASIDGDCYVLTLRKKLGDVTEVRFTEPTADAWLVMEKVNPMKRPISATLEFIKSVTCLGEVLDADMRRMSSSDYKTLTGLANFFLA